MTPIDERDIATTLRALVDGRIDAARAAASLAAVVTQAARVARAEGHHAGREAGMLEAAAECERRGYYGTARILTRMARPVEVLVVRPGLRERILTGLAAQQREDDEARS